MEIEPGDLVAVRGLGSAFNNETFKVVETLHGANFTVEITAKALLKCTADTENDTVPAPPLSNVIAWYDASVFSSLTLSSGSTVVGVEDLSGNANHLGDGSMTDRPIYSSTGFNSRPTMIFSALQKLPSTNDFSMGTGNTLTFWMVGTLASSSEANGRAISYRAGLSSDYNNVGNWIFFRNTSSTSVGFMRNTITALKSISYDTPYRFIGTINSSGVMTIYVDGVASSTATSSGNWLPGLPGGQFAIGGSVADIANWNGKFSEVGISTAFSDATAVATLDSLLKTKWGL